MKKFCQKTLLYFKMLWNKFKKFPWPSKSCLLTFLFSFIFVFTCIYTTFQRSIAVKKIRAEMPLIISSLNELGLDIAYDDIKFNPIVFFPLMKIHNPQIYTLSEDGYWHLRFNDLKIYNNIFGSPQLTLKFSSAGNLAVSDQSYNISNQKTSLELKNLSSLPKTLLEINGFNINNFVLINNASFSLIPSTLPDVNAKGLPTYSSRLEIKDVTINGMVNYPLSSYINMISAKADIISQFTFDGDLLTSLESWVKDGGFVDIPQLIVQWAPLTLVGRGQIKLKENLQSEISFNTSSKGLLKLIKSLQDIGFINNSNVYVANILLSNKAFRLDPDDEELTITTPISYSNDKISIENLVIKDFNKETQQ